MIFTEIHKDLFTVDKSYYLAHCIASDFIMGAGIAVRFQKEFSLRNKLRESKLDTKPGWIMCSNRESFQLDNKK